MDSQQNRVSNSEEPPRAVELGLYLGLQWGGGGGDSSTFYRNFNISLWFNDNKKAVISVQSFTKYSIFIVDVKSGRFMYQSGRAGDETKSISLPPKAGELASLGIVECLRSEGLSLQILKIRAQ